MDFLFRLISIEKFLLPELSEKLMKKEIILSKGFILNLASGMKLNSTRMGFGWMNLNESERALHILEQTIKQ